MILSEFFRSAYKFIRNCKPLKMSKRLHSRHNYSKLTGTYFLIDDKTEVRFTKIWGRFGFFTPTGILLEDTELEESAESPDVLAQEHEVIRGILAERIQLI